MREPQTVLAMVEIVKTFSREQFLGEMDELEALILERFPLEKLSQEEQETLIELVRLNRENMETVSKNCPVLVRETIPMSQAAPHIVPSLKEPTR